ncbi:hypothetical protein C2E23DRAFT_864300 [Lenzites betulinus]|nr:hypothetical protein C2E23DRAFT_864300 [Lenzites betulinus]
MHMLRPLLAGGTAGLYGEADDEREDVGRVVFGVASNLNRHAKTCCAAHQAGAAGSSCTGGWREPQYIKRRRRSPTEALAADTYIAPAPAPIPASQHHIVTSRKRKASALDDTAPMADPSSDLSLTAAAQSSEQARLRRKRDDSNTMLSAQTCLCPPHNASSSHDAPLPATRLAPYTTPCSLSIATPLARYYTLLHPRLGLRRHDGIAATIGNSETITGTQAMLESQAIGTSPGLAHEHCSLPITPPPVFRAPRSATQSPVVSIDRSSDARRHSPSTPHPSTSSTYTESQRHSESPSDKSTQWSQFGSTGLAIVQSFVNMFETPGTQGSRHSSTQTHESSAHRLSSPSPHQPSWEPESPSCRDVPGKPPPNTSSHTDSGSDTKPELDPIYDAYCVGYSDGHRDVTGPPALQHDDPPRGTAIECFQRSSSTASQDLTLMEADTRTYIPVPSTRAGCHLTPRSRKRISLDLPPEDITRDAVKRFKKEHAALILDLVVCNVNVID